MSVKDFPPFCARLAIAIVGLSPTILSLKGSPLAPGVRRGVPGKLPRQGRGRSPRPIPSTTASKFLILFSASSLPRLSFSISSLSTLSRCSAFWPTPAHSSSRFSTISLACFSRSSIMATSRLRPLASLANLVSCSASCPVRS